MSLKSWFYKKIGYREGMTFGRWDERRTMGKWRMERYHKRKLVKQAIPEFEAKIAKETNAFMKNKLKEEYHWWLAGVWLNGYMIGKRWRGYKYMRDIYLK